MLAIWEKEWFRKRVLNLLQAILYFMVVCYLFFQQFSSPFHDNNRVFEINADGCFLLKFYFSTHFAAVYETLLFKFWFSFVCYRFYGGGKWNVYFFKLFNFALVLIDRWACILILYLGLNDDGKYLCFHWKVCVNNKAFVDNTFVLLLSVDHWFVGKLLLSDKRFKERWITLSEEPFSRNF